MRLINKIFDYFSFDGCKHIILSAIILIILSIFLPKIIAAAITLGLGLFKEFVYDKYMKKGTFDTKDIVADIVGIIIGLL